MTMADFADPFVLPALWDETLAIAGGQINAVVHKTVVNSAGRIEANQLKCFDIEWLDDAEHALRINLTSAAQSSCFALLHWQACGTGGRLVHVVSRAAYHKDSPAHRRYDAAKGGMVAMHKTIAPAYAGEGILRFAVALGFTDTAMAGDYIASCSGPGLLADIPLGRVATPGEITAIIAFCGLDAPPSMTGAVIDADGAGYVR
jgi:NAD(P)-dependent dehydrogenase (short-subunit alcohol dehydrogenase family)